MKVLTKYTLISVLKVGFATALLAALMLVGVDLFSNLDSYIGHSLGFGKAFMLSMLYYPEAFLLALGPSFLFSTTYFLSMLNASNEMICVLNSGVSSRRVVTPLLILAVMLALFYFGFNETIAIKSSNLKDSRTQFATSDSSIDNTDIALSDMQDGYMVYASRYEDETSTLYNASYIELSGKSGEKYSIPDSSSNADSNANSGTGLRRIDAYKAVYNEAEGFWTFNDCYVYTTKQTHDGETVDVSYLGMLDVERMKLEPQLFRNLSSEISKMSLDLAHAYLLRMKGLNPDEYARLGTEYYKRIFSCLTPLIMMVIACSMNYRFKKNVLFFSLICSICIAVVYYVIQMMTVMLADQGVIAPWLGILIPFAVILGLSGIMSIIMK